MYLSFLLSLDIRAVSVFSIKIVLIHVFDIILRVRASDYLGSVFWSNW